MSFLKFLHITINSYSKNLSELDENDIIRIEKILKSEIKMNSDLDTNFLEVFLDALQKGNKEINALIQNEFFEVITGIFWIHQGTTELVEDKKLKDFISNYLSDDLNNFCDTNFAKENYRKIQRLVDNYRKILPDEIVERIETKVSNKLDYLITNLENDSYRRPNIRQSDIFKLAPSIQSEKIFQKLRKIDTLVLKRINKTMSTHGFIYFFETFFRGLEFIGKKPTSIEEKEEKKFALGEFRFIMYITLGIAILIGSVSITVSNKRKQDKQIRNEIRKEQLEKNFKNSFLGFLTTYTPETISDVKPIDSLKTGDNVFNFTHKNTNSIYKGDSIVIKNNSDFDLVLISYNPFRSQDKQYGNSYYIKSKEELKVYPMVGKMYMGKGLATFSTKETNQNTYIDIPRFTNPVKPAKELIQKDFDFVRSDIEITNKEQEIKVSFTKYVTTNGRNDYEFIFK